MTLKIEIKTVSFFLVFLYCILIGTLAFFAIILPPEFDVDPEYLNGILTASSIFFAFWGYSIEKRPRQRMKKLWWEQYTIEAFFFSFAFLIASVVSMYLSAMGYLRSGLALGCLFISFGCNSALLAVELYAQLRWSKVQKRIAPS